MAKKILKKVKKAVKPVKEEVTSPYPAGYDPDMPENKQRHLR